jgi:hypothetical protein
MVLWRKANEFQPGTDLWKWASLWRLPDDAIDPAK